MAKRAVLFETKGDDPYNGLKHPRHPVTAAPPGTGPEGRTCKDCYHHERSLEGGRFYQKCGLMRKFWTGTPRSDIKCGWSACSKFAPSWETEHLNSKKGKKNARKS